jgi:hypothetical protein
MFLGLIASAQVPFAFKYQVVARDAEGQILANRNVTIKISILKSNEKGTVVYSELHTTKSNLFGLIDLVIGKGNILSGTLNGLNWSADCYYFQVDMDPDGGSAFQPMGISQMLSVPYALYSQDVVNNDDADPDPLNEIQKLTINGNTLTLDNGGGSVTLPVSGVGDNWGNQVAATNSTIAGNGTPTNPLGVVHSQLQPLWSQILEKPAGFSDNIDNVEDGDADPGNEIQVLTKNGNTVLLSRNGGSFTDSVDDADSDPLNEIQKLTINGNTLTLDNGGGSVTLPVSGVGDNWGNQVAATNSTIAGNGTPTNPLGVVHSQLQPLWSQILEKPAGFSDNIDNVEDGDADPRNEFNTRMEWDDHENVLSISDSGGKLSTVLTGFLENESDGSVNNEGSLSVGPGTDNTSHILSNTKDSQPVILQAGLNVSISESQNVITIEANDTNTTYTPGTGIDITNNTISLKGVASEHFLGELFGGGIVFWLTPDCQHGLIASLRDIDSGEGIVWSNITEVEIGLNARSMTNGLANTEAIITQTGHITSAAKLCADYVADGFSDWYLPSDRELVLLASRDYLIDNILDNDNDPGTTGFIQEYNPPTYGSYWSSTEGSAAYSWVFDFGYGGIYDVTKNLTYRVRAIRKF